MLSKYDPASGEQALLISLYTVAIEVSRFTFLLIEGDSQPRLFHEGCPKSGLGQGSVKYFTP